MKRGLRLCAFVRGLALAIAVLVVVFGLAGVACADTGHITGTVTAQTGGAPLEGIQVAAYREVNEEGDVWWAHSRVALTDSSGNYDIGDLPAGTYRLVFSGNDDYAPECYDNIPGSSVGTSTCKNIPVTDGATVPNKNAALADASHITGTVTAQTGGAALDGMDVEAYRLSTNAYGETDWSSVGDAQTDASGHYDIPGLAQGTYRLVFDGNNDFLTECYNNVPGSDVESSTCTNIAVAAATTVPGKNAALATASHITGTVTAETGGAALEGMGVEAYAQFTDPEDGSTYWDSVSYAETDASGHYDLGGIPAGTYRLRFVGNNNYLTECYNNVPGSDVDSASCTSVVVGTAATVPNKNAALATAGHITGTVTAENGGAPINNASVAALSQVTDQQGYTYWQWDDSADTDASGNYDLGGLTAGTYRLTFAADGFAPECYNNVAGTNLDDPSCANVAVGAGATVVGKNAALATGSHITGTVTAEAGGAPLASIWIEAYARAADADGNTYWTYAGDTWTDSSGNYDLGSLWAGTYRLVFHGDDTHLTECYDNVPGEDVNDPRCSSFTVGSAATVTGKNAALATASHITGTVTAESGGAPLADMDVEAARLVTYPDGSTYWDWVSDAPTDALGHYDLGGLSPGTYRIFFYGTDHGPVTYAPECYNNVPGTNIEDPGCTNVVVGAAATVTGKDAALASASHITGTVTAESGGAPIADTEVDAYAKVTNADGTSGWQQANYAFTDATGAYDLDGLAAGTYRLTFGDGSSTYAAECYNDVPGDDVGNAACTDVPVAAGATASGKNAALALGSHITGTVTADSGGAPIQGIRVHAYQLRGQGASAQYQWVTSASTGASGAYDVEGLAAGTYRLVFNEGGSDYRNDTYDTETYDNVPGSDVNNAACTNVAVTKASTVTGKNAGLGLTSADHTPPTVPTGLSGVALTSTYVRLSWAPSTDGGSGVSRYRVYRNGIQLNGDTFEPTYDIDGLTPGSTYSFTVVALDNAGNPSAASAPVSVTMPIDSGAAGVAGPGASSVTVDLATQPDVVVSLNAATGGAIKVLCMAVSPGPATSGFQIPGYTFDISYTGTIVPGTKFTITLPYSASLPDASAAGIVITHWKNGAWQVITPTSINYAAHTVTFQTDSLSPFAVEVPLASTTTTVVTPALKTTQLSGAALSPSKPNRKKATTFSAVLTPAAAGGSAKLALYQQLTKVVKKKVKGKTKKVKVLYWKLRNTASMKVNAATGKFTAALKLKYAGKWQMVVTYSPGTGYAGCPALTKNFTVK